MRMHQPKRILVQTIFAISVSLLNLATSMAETGGKGEQSEILVIGTSPIESGNVAKAREMAISSALIKGVEGYLAKRLGSQGMINYFPRLLYDVIPKAREEIENFHILAEERIDGYYKILVRVKVNEKVMEEKLRDIGLVLMEGPPIKILFLVSQLEPSEGKFSYWWKDPESQSSLTPVELALHRVFQERGFRPINRLLSVAEGEYSSEMQVLELSDVDAIRWGSLFSADVVVHGRCEIIEGREIYLSLKALHVVNAFMIYRDTQTESLEEDLGDVEQIIQSIEKAIDNVATRLAPEIIGAVEEPDAKINQLAVTLQGLRSYRQFREFKVFLEKNISGVRSVKQTKVKGDALSISVEFLGDKDKFVALLSGHEKLPFRADVSRSEEGEIFVTLR